RRVVDDVHIPSPAETLLGIRPDAAEPAGVTLLPVVAETEPGIIAPVPDATAIPRQTLFEAPPATSGGWAALAAAVALFASAAAGALNPDRGRRIAHLPCAAVAGRPLDRVRFGSRW